MNDSVPDTGGVFFLRSCFNDLLTGQPFHLLFEAGRQTVHLPPITDITQHRTGFDRCKLIFVTEHNQAGAIGQCLQKLRQQGEIEH